MALLKERKFKWKTVINETYCKLKLKSIEQSAEIIQKTLGAQAR